MDYLLGSHPVWEICRSVYQMKKRPYFIGGLLILVSYAWNWIRRVERTMPADLIAFRQRDQIQRLKSAFRRTVHLEPRLADKASAEHIS